MCIAAFGQPVNARPQDGTSRGWILWRKHWSNTPDPAEMGVPDPQNLISRRRGRPAVQRTIEVFGFQSGGLGHGERP